MTSHRAYLQQIYLAQVWVRAHKVCEMCGTYLPVEDFDGYGAQPCEECRLERQRSLGLWVRSEPKSRS